MDTPLRLATRPASSDPHPQAPANGRTTEAAAGAAGAAGGAHEAPVQTLAISPLPPADGNDSGRHLQEISDKLSALGDRIERTQFHRAEAPLPSEHLAAVQQLTVTIQQLPQAVAEALGEALRQQHRMILDDVRTLLNQFLAAQNAAPAARADQT